MEDLARPYVGADDDLEQEYRDAAEDEAAEAAAYEWIEAHLDEALE